MPKRSRRYETVRIDGEDLLQALEWLEEHLSGATITLRLVRPGEGKPYLQAHIAGYRRAVRLGQAPRQTAAAKFPTAQGVGLLPTLYNLVYTIADEVGAEEPGPGGRFTELIPGFPQR